MPSRSPLWTPSPQRAQASQMHQFLRLMADKHCVAPEWEALRTWAIDRRDLFWSEFLEFAQILPSVPAERPVVGEGMLDTQWFPGMKLNYARHMLRFDDDQPAIIFEGERGQAATYSHADLRAEVARCGAALDQVGVKTGDRVAGFMPNIPETIIAMLAAASRGAPWSSCSPDFGVRGVLDRFGQIEPTVLVVADGYSYGGKRIETLPRVADMLAQLPSVKRVVVVPFLDAEPDISALPNAVLWRDFLGPTDAPAPELTFVEVPFAHPLFIMYSSGTTGIPKCIVHGHGGTLFQLTKELVLHCDLRQGERSFYFTTCGWMMWNWLVSALGIGTTVVLYEGNPAHPTIHRLWEFAAKHKVNLFGTSPKYLGVVQKADLHPGREHDLSALRIMCSTGSPLSEELFEWVYREVKDDLQLASICGGTDIISCFILGNPLLPVYAGEVQCRGLGMDVQSWTDDAGRCSIRRRSWCAARRSRRSRSAFGTTPTARSTRPPISSTSGTGADAPVVWRHGDFVEIKSDTAV